MYAEMSDILHERIIGEYSIEKFSIKERDLYAMAVSYTHLTLPTIA